MTHSLKTKPVGFKPGLVFLAIFTFAMGALGVFGWWQSDMDQFTRFALCFGAGATALVIPFTVIVLGRSYASLGVLPVLAICMLMQAVSFHNFVGVVIEAPHRAAFDKGLEPLQAEVTRTTQLADTAQAALDKFPALQLPDCLCPKTTAAKVAAWEAQRAPLATELDKTKAERKAAQAALDEAAAKYAPMIPDFVLWIVGGLLDGSIALAIWSLEATARKLRKEHEAKLAAEAQAEAKREERRQEKARKFRAQQRAEREKAKAKAAKAAAKAKPPQGFKPFLVAAND